MSTQQGDPATERSRERHGLTLAGMVAGVGEFYRDPEPSEGHGQVVSLLALGCAALLFVTLVVPYFIPPFGGPYFPLYIAGLTVILGGVSILRRERGRFGAAAAVATVGAAGFIAFMFAFAFGISWLLGILMPD